MIRKRFLASMVVAVTAAGLVVTPGTAWAYDPITGFGDDNQPYAQPADVDVPKRGCATIAADPAAPPVASIPAVQVVYAWHSGNGDHYSSYVQQIAKKVDRIDWMLDESTNYDQHVNLSCKYTPNSTYADYANALVAKFEVTGLTPAELSGTTDSNRVRDKLKAAGFVDSNRYYLVFADFDSLTNAFWCPGAGGDNPGVGHCSAVIDEWYSTTAAHELFHVLGVAPHAWSQETGVSYNADLMSTNFWALDQDFVSYYDPSETTASFYEEKYPSTDLRNVANAAALTTPVCCDIGFSNDLLTAQERTIEADAPYANPTGFTIAGGGWAQVTPPGSQGNQVSARYYDGRRSLTMNVQTHAEGYVSVTRRPAVTAGEKYKFFARLTTSTSGTVRLRISWYNAANALIGSALGDPIAVNGTWEEYDMTATAPAGAASAQLTVVSPTGQQPFAYQLDTLNFNHCNNPRTADNCRTSV